MKITLVLFFTVFTISLFAQSYPDPEFVEKPMYYDVNTKQLSALERQIHPSQASSGFNQTFAYKGTTSSLHISKANGVQFLIRLFNSLEPDLILFLYPLSVTNSTRQIKIHISLKDSGTAQGAIPFQYRKVGESLYMLTIENIEPGEYVWFLKSASYLFTVE